ncbi:DUF2092 domain-containing protein [Formosa algae]|uniref:DUF2092 domain-containing protein n=1 Tax=Formosa algae TaxID=225843 RepID=A0A9X0YJF8_9FLAO|nr:DUF2092 domain-containing protein [Formosa algae]MBP1838214.1 hypothetical protein [Formosa algae]MDQ0334349.1 hypothetical protein [Formosa algae]OEI80768.1 hypothetical protein AST99_07775 [Formosa algae]PNW30019.1 hypothetical protein BKP44_02015 [Formosa algae]
MKKYITLFVLSVLPYATFAQNEDKKIDLDAIMLYDQMGEAIGELSSVSFHLSTITEEFDADKKTVNKYNECDVKMVGPDKLSVKQHSKDKHSAYYYNGEVITYYSFSENNYITVDAPDNIIDMIDFMHDNFSMDFPAADFFYPTFTDDIIENFDTITYIGLDLLGGEECNLTQIENENVIVKIWISDEAHTLPKQFEITYKKKDNLKFQATFSDWQLSPELNDDIFDFTPPASARLISVLIAKS